MTIIRDKVALAQCLLSPKFRAGRAYSSADSGRLVAEISEKARADSVEIALAAFPFKMRNPLKTIDDAVDWGERIALERLKHVVDEARGAWYEVHWKIITDGSFYADELCADPAVAKAYRASVVALAQEIGLEAEFIDLADLVDPKSIPDHRPLSYDSADKGRVLRAAGMFDLRDRKDELFALYDEFGSVPAAIEALVERDKEIREQAEISAGIYLGRKLYLERVDLIGNHFPRAVRASIQNNPNRNLYAGHIQRPLGIRLSDSRGATLFPWLGVASFGSVRRNVYLADALASGKQEHEKEGLRYFK